MEVFDELFFKTIFYEYYDRIFTRFLKKTGSETTADELTQLTFIKFWEYRHSFTFSLPMALQLNRTAKLIFIDWLRKEAHQRKLKSELNTIPSSGASAAGRFELTNTIQSALNQLPPMRKKVFQLAYIEGFSHKEIAAQLSISTKTVDAHIAKALQQMRKVIAFASVLSIILK